MTGRWPDFLEVHRPGGVGLWLSLRIPVMPSPPCHRKPSTSTSALQMATENCTLWGETWRAAGKFSR